LHRSIQSDLLPASIGLPRSDQRRRAGSRILAEETPIALVYNGSTLAVVMASPVDLTDLAIGFSLTEGIVRSPAEIDDIEIAHHPDGIELRVWLASECGRRLLARRRQLVGPTGCGLCGIESLCEANRPLPRVRRAISLPARHIAKAVRALTNEQHLNVATRATHAAGFCCGLLPAGSSIGSRAGGRRSAQCLGQACRCTRSSQCIRRHWYASCHQPRVYRTRSESRNNRRQRFDRCLGAYCKGRSIGRAFGDHLDRYRPRRRVRSIQPRDRLLPPGGKCFPSIGFFRLSCAARN
jgi:hypothetical protein